MILVRSKIIDTISQSECSPISGRNADEMFCFWLLFSFLLSDEGDDGTCGEQPPAHRPVLPKRRSPDRASVQPAHPSQQLQVPPRPRQRWDHQSIIRSITLITQLTADSAVWDVLLYCQSVEFSVSEQEAVLCFSCGSVGRRDSVSCSRSGRLLDQDPELPAPASVCTRKHHVTAVTSAPHLQHL